MTDLSTGYSKIQFAERIAIAILNKEHDQVMEYAMDDSEYIPMLKRIIESISETLFKEGHSKKESAQFSVSAS